LISYFRLRSVCYLYSFNTLVRYFILTLVALISDVLVHSQCFENNTAFKEGEVLNYEIYYNWGFIWLNAGYVEFKVKEGQFRNRPIYYFDGYGATYKSYDWIFKVRDHYQSYLDKELLRPVLFYSQTDEGGYEAETKYYFDQSNSTAYLYTQNSERPFRKDTLRMPPCTFDVFSLVYYSRNIDFSKVKAGDSVPVIVLLDTSVYNVYIRYLGKEVFESKDGKKYKCIKFSALLVEGTIFKGGEDLFAWVTDDKNKIPVLVEAKILVGSVKAYLRSVQENRNPMDALISN
jgi:hypothetical protein